jgi:hypothetical protein
MHPYASDFGHKPKIIAVLFFISGLVSSGVAFALAKVGPWFGFTGGGISAMTAFGFLYWLLDAYLWKVEPIRGLLLVPDLNGTWEVTGETIYGPDGVAGTKWEGTMEIVQSWSKISIVQKTTQSTSRSDSACIFHSSGEGFILAFNYGNKPGISETAMSRHAGTCRFIFVQSGTSGSGEYYTDHSRKTAG